jgi:hypothetical protein
MTKILGVCSLLLFFCSLSVDAATNPPKTSKSQVTNPVYTTKAFYRDDQLWPLTLNTVTNKYEIPVCWENLTTINNNPLWKQRRINTLLYANAAWGDTTNVNTNPTGAGSASLLSFVDKGQCPSVSAGFAGVRILVSSTFPLILPSGRLLLPPYTKALGSKLKNLVNGVVLDFDNKKAYNDGQLFVLDSCKKQGVSEENCYKAVITHEFGHIVGMSHEHNRIDQPLSYETRLCAGDDPSVVQGQLIFGNLRIGTYDTTSIMDYCNTNRVKNPVLSTTDKVALRVFYGRMPSLSLDLGYPVITIPAVFRGITKVPYSMQLSDPTNTGKFKAVFSLAPTKGKSSVPATYLGSLLTIPYLKVTSFGKVTGIQSRTMTLQTSTGFFRNTTLTNLYSTSRQ